MKFKKSRKIWEDKFKCIVFVWFIVKWGGGVFIVVNLYSCWIFCILLFESLCLVWCGEMLGNIIDFFIGEWVRLIMWFILWIVMDVRFNVCGDLFEFMLID